MKKEENIIYSAWIASLSNCVYQCETFYFQIICSEEKESADLSKTLMLVSLSSQFYQISLLRSSTISVLEVKISFSLTLWINSESISEFLCGLFDFENWIFAFVKGINYKISPFRWYSFCNNAYYKQLHEEQAVRQILIFQTRTGILLPDILVFKIEGGEVNSYPQDFTSISMEHLNYI